MNLNTQSFPIDLGEFRIDFSYDKLYRTISVSNVFSPSSYPTLVNGFNSIKWTKKKTDFYSQYESIVTPNDQTSIALLYSKKFYFPFKAKLETVLNTKLRDDIRLIAHKLESADEIEVHNDYCDPKLGYEQFRFIFQFATPYIQTRGGDIYFLSSQDKQAIIRKNLYSENAGVCFEISPHSYHFVDPVEGERYTLIMYLWEQGKPYDGSGYKVRK